MRGVWVPRNTGPTPSPLDVDVRPVLVRTSNRTKRSPGAGRAGQLRHCAPLYPTAPHRQPCSGAFCPLRPVNSLVTALGGRWREMARAAATESTMDTGDPDITASSALAYPAHPQVGRQRGGKWRTA